MALELWISVGGLVCTVIGGLAAFNKWSTSHGRCHQEVDGRLASLESAAADGRLVDKDVAHALEILKQGVCELLVHQGLRKPGQGINGE